MLPLRIWLGLVSFVVVMAGLSGCRNPSSPPPRDAGAHEKNTFDALHAVRFASVKEAFARLESLTYSARVDVEERGQQGDVVARSAATFDVAASRSVAPTQEFSTSGTFSDGFLSFLAGTSQLRYKVGSLNDQLIPDKPAFADLKLREQFAYSAARDTTVNGIETRLYVARAVVPSSVQPIREARVATTTSDSSIVYVRLDRDDHSIFYEGQSRLEISLVRSPSGLLPAKKRLEVSVGVPFEPVRQFLLVESYEHGELETSNG